MKMPNLFASDGCIAPNIQTKTYRVALQGNCEHTKIRCAVIVLDAVTADAAVSFVESFLLIPQTHVIAVSEDTES